MNWDAVSAISEAVGAIAVVITLIYLAIQIRQNTRSVRSSRLQSNTAVWASMFCNLAHDSVATAYSIGMAGKANIKPIQYSQFFLLCRALFVAFENQYYQYRQGALDKSTYQGYERSISCQLLAFPGFRIWWAQNRGIFSPEFETHVDDMMTRAPEIHANRYLEEWQALAAEKAEAQVRDTGQA